MELVANVSSSQALTSNANTDIIFDNVTTSPSSPGASYNSGTGVFTAGTGGGTYIVNAQAISSTQTFIGIMAIAGGVTYYGTLVSNNQFPSPLTRSSICIVVKLTAGQTIKIASSANTAGGTIGSESRITILKL
jgi:hypothetical protein